MKSYLLKLPSFLFHPLWLSTYAMLYYFSQVNFMYTYERILAKILAVILLTAVAPLLFLILLKPLKLIDSLHIDKIHQRKIPLLFFTTISAIITNYIFDPIDYRIPFYFFSSAFVCGIVSFVFTFINHKISLHAIGISSFTTFVIGFNIVFNLELFTFMSVCIICVGLVLTSRLYMGAHNIYELISGTFMGCITQIIFMQFWVY